MGLRELHLRDFRLFRALDFIPDPDAITVLISPNGTGKSSVLEAVYCLATGGSFRTTSAADMIRTEASLAEVHGVIHQSDRRVAVDLTVSRTSRGALKRMRVNGQRPTSRAELADALPLTIFTPEGVDVVRHGPEPRREFLTHLLTDLHPTTGPLVERVARLLTQRNALLRRAQGDGMREVDLGELDVWDHDLATSGEELALAREGVVTSLAPDVTRFYTALAQDDQVVDLVYERSWTGSLHEALRRSRRDDLARGHTTRGPHRDDLVVRLAGRDARRQASQGEQRSLALALRLAGHDLVRKGRGVEPLLLLDDVFSELDPGRADRLLALLPGGQTLVTTASPLPERMTPAAVVDVSTMGS